MWEVKVIASQFFLEGKQKICLSHLSLLILKTVLMLSFWVQLLWSHLVCWGVILLGFLKNCDKLNIISVPKSPPPFGDKWKERMEAGGKAKTDGVIAKSMWDTKHILLQTLKGTFSMPRGCRPCSTVSMVIKSYWHAAYTALVLISKDEWTELLIVSQRVQISSLTSKTGHSKKTHKNSSHILTHRNQFTAADEA